MDDKTNSMTYRAAFAHWLQQRADANDQAQLRDFGGWTTDAQSAGPTVPTTLVNQILEVAAQHAPLLSMITLQHVPGKVKYFVAGAVADAAAHAEGAVIPVAEDGAPVPVELDAYEIAKLVEISASVRTMALPAFEQWLVRNVGEAVGRKIEHDILGGTGTGEATGIDTGITWTEGTNLKTVAASAALKATDVYELIGMLPGAFDAQACFVMSKKTLYADFAGLQDKSKNDLMVREGREYTIQGYPVILDERVALHNAFLGDFTAYHGNMPESVTLHSAYDITRNVDQYSGTAQFDGKPVLAAAFVKLAKASA